MSTTTLPAPVPFKAYASLRRFTVNDYEKMIDAGILTDEDKVELMDGFVVDMLPRTPLNDGATGRLHRLLSRMADRWIVRCRSGTCLSTSQLEPDIAVARRHENAFNTRHPGPPDLVLVVEVSDSSLDRDRHDKGRIYANDGIPVYWVVNLVDRQVEVYSNPTGPVPDARYQRQQVYHAGASVVVELDGVAVGSVAVTDLLP